MNTNTQHQNQRLISRLAGAIFLALLALYVPLPLDGLGATSVISQAHAQEGDEFVEFNFPIPYKIVAKHSFKCLDVQGWNRDNGGVIQEWECHGNFNQQWRLEPGSQPDTFMLVAGHSGKCLDVQGWNRDNGGIVQQWDCHGGDNQLWRIRRVASSNYHQLVAVHSNKCLEVLGGYTENGGYVWQMECNEGGNQLWGLDHPLVADLAAVDWCFRLNRTDGEITFYPIIGNLSDVVWHSELDGQYTFGAEIGPARTFLFPPGSDWAIFPGERKPLDEGVTNSYHPDNHYRLFNMWFFTHPADANPFNNQLDNLDYIVGYEFLPDGPMAHKACR